MLESIRNAKSLAAAFGALALTMAGACSSGDSGGGSAGSPSGGAAGNPFAGSTSTSGTFSTAGSPTAGTFSGSGAPGAGSGGTTSTAGTAGTGGTGVSGGATSTAGAAGSTAGTTTTGCMPNPTAQACSGTAAPADGVVIDFATYAASGTWGVAAMGDLTGGTSPYGTPAITRTPEGGNLRLQVMLPAMGFSGVVFWFGPCVNASAYGGLSLTAGGSLGGAVLKFQVQTHVDYPVDVANTKGACIFTNCDTRFSECMGPTATVAVPATAAPITLPWSAFTNGRPTAAVTPEGLLGLQFQLECQSMSPCAVDMTLGTITLTPP